MAKSLLHRETLVGTPSRLETVVRSAFEGTNGFHYSHSFGTVVGSGTSANVQSSAGLYNNRIKTRLMMSTMTSRSTAGYWANDITTNAYAGANLWTPNTRGLVLWDGTENDLLSDGGTAQGIVGYKNAVRAFLWILFCGTRIEHTDSSFTFPVGTWALETAAAETSGGTANISFSAGASAQITYTGTDAVLFLIGRQDGDTVNSTVANGGTAQVQLDGVTVATQSLSQQFIKPSGPTTRARGPIAIPLLGMTNTAHTITVTNTGTAGTALSVDCIAPVTSTPPEVLMFRQCYFGSGQYVNFSSAAGVDAFNAALELVVAEFTALNKPVQTVHIENGFDTATMLSTTQSRHPNDTGSRHYADRAVELLALRPPRLGLNNL
jgi:hypothetical protein